MIEILDNLDVLKMQSWKLSDLQMAGVAYGSEAFDFPLERVSQVTLAPIVKSSSWYRDIGARYYDEIGKELALDQVIENVIQTKGVLHFEGGISFKIENGKVSGFAIYGNLLRHFDSLKTYENCLNAFGRPDKIDRKEAYGDLMGFELYFTNKEMLVSWDSMDDRVSLINLGKFNE